MRDKAEKVGYMQVRIGQVPGGKLRCARACGNWTDFGLLFTAVGAPEVHVVCPRCCAAIAARYQEVHPEERLIEVAWNIEGPQLKSALAGAIEATARDCKVPMTDVVIGRIADAILVKLDEGKF